MPFYRSAFSLHLPFTFMVILRVVLHEGWTSSRQSLPCSPLDRLYGCGIVRLAHLIDDILDVDDAVAAINHHDQPLQLVPLPEPHTVVLTELHAVMGRQRLMQHARPILPACLHLG